MEKNFRYWRWKRFTSFHALDSSPDCSAWVVDPIVEGSNKLMFEQYESMKKIMTIVG